MIALGVDYSTRKCAVAAHAEGRFNARSIELKPAKQGFEERFRILMDWYAENVAAFVGEGALVAIEAPIIGPSGGTQVGLQMAMVAGGLLEVSHELFRREQVHLVQSAVWKKVVLGSGSLRKPQVTPAMQQLHPDLLLSCSTQDEVDAACLALWADRELQTSALPL